MTELREGIAVALDTLGCKLNQAETELLARQFVEAGYRLVSAVSEADVYVLNTCSVTHIADRKSRQRLRLAHRLNPGALVIAAGCYVERAPHEVAQISGVNLVVDNKQKQNLVALVGRMVRDGRGALHGCPGNNNHAANYRTRAFVKAQDGCNSYCSYCIVPLVRGEERSLPAEQVIAEVRDRTTRGYNEVVLTGTKVGSYNDKGLNLGGLLQRILAETSVSRLRLSSLQPQEITPELVRLWCDQRLCRHFHLSLQSGSDGVLAKMNRRYSTGDYRQAIALIRSEVPEVAITTDVIVGFPGETSEEFQQSYDFCKQMEFARIHVFPYSSRQETQAAQMPRQVEARVKKQRSEQMLALAEESARNFSRRFLGRTVAVLWEKRSADGIWSGLTANYLKVYTTSSEDLTNRLLAVKLADIRGDGVWGECNKNYPLQS